MAYVLTGPPLLDIRAGVHRASTEICLSRRDLYQPHTPPHVKLLVCTRRFFWEDLAKRD
jgi:hypothetical protein